MIILRTRRNHFYMLKMTKQTNCPTCETPATSEDWTKWRIDKRLGKRKLEQHDSETVIVKIEPATEPQISETVFVKIEPAAGDDDKSIEYWRKDEDSRSVLEKIGQAIRDVADDESVVYWRADGYDESGFKESWQVCLI